MKLVGGGPKKIAEVRKANAEKLAALAVRKTQALTTVAERVAAENTALTTLNGAKNDYQKQQAKLTLAWKILGAASDEQKPRINATYQQERQHSQQKRAFYRISLDIYKERVGVTVQGYRDVISVIDDIKRTAHQPQFDREHAAQFFALWEQQDQLRTQLASFGLGSGVFSLGMSAVERFTLAYAELEKGEPDNYYVLIEGLKTTRAYHDQIVAVSIVQEKLLDEMAQASAFGKSFRDDLLSRLEHPENYLPENTQLGGIDIVQELALDRSVPPVQNSIESLLFLQFEHIKLRPTISAHVEMSTSRGYSTTDRIAVLETIVERYSAAEQIGQNLKKLNPAYIRREYLQSFLDDVMQGRTLAENDLKTLIMDTEGNQTVTPPPKALRQKPATKRVFKTRSRGTLVGDLRQANAKVPEQHIVVVDPSNGDVLGRFHEHAGEGVYVEIEEAPAPPPLPKPARSARAISAAAQDVAARRESIESTVQRELKQMDRDEVLREEKVPRDWEFMLTQEAEKLEALATELEHTAPSAETTRTATQWRVDAQQMKAAGQHYRITGYLKQSPTVHNVEYLWHAKAVDIKQIKAREATNAKDFLSEYAVSDRESASVLWYAHFHYNNAVGLNTAYTSGHLKRADQRYVGFMAQLAQARSNSSKVIRIWRSKIPIDKARSLFFHTD